MTTVRTTVVPVTKLYGDALYGKLRGVVVDQGTNTWLKLVMYSPGVGAPMTISVGSYSTVPTVQIKIREATGNPPTTYIPDTGDEPTLADDGTYLLLPLPVEVKNLPGVFRAQTRVLEADGSEIARDEFLILVQRGFWLADGTTPDDVGPPTVLEVRSALRDHPGANRLLGEYEFDAAEIGHALVSAVQDFNNSFPTRQSPKFNTLNFPVGWRRHWLDGAIGYLFETAASYARRGHLPYSAGGVQINDLDREREYTAAATMYRERYQKFLRLKAAELSIAAGWGSLGSGGPGVFTSRGWP